MNLLIKFARSVELSLGDRDFGSLASVINETLRVNGRGAKV